MKTYEKMVVIFVDLLGTQNNKKFDDKFFIHRLFHSEVKANENRKHEHVVYDRKVYSFSDCAYFFYYYKEGIDDSRKDDIKLIQIAMYNTSISLLRILNAGYLIRGGIAFGDAYFDELGFFGPAVEEAYSLESNYADIPIVAINPELGNIFFNWEESMTDQNIVSLLMTSRPMLVEKECEKYFLNLFYSLEMTPNLQLEEDEINIDDVKNNLFLTISRDKQKYKSPQNTNNIQNKSTIYQKLDWFEKYLSTKHNRLRPEIAMGAFSGIVSGD